MARLPSEREDFEQPYRYDNVPKLIDRSPPVENSRDPAREFVRDIKENLRDARETQQPKQTGQVTKEEVGDIIEGHLIRAMELLKVYRSLEKEEVGDIIEGHLIRAMELLKVYRSLD